MKTLIETKLDNFKLRFATEEDLSLILSFIRELADFEEMLHEVVATEEILKESINFYKQQGAVPMEDWTVYRVHDKALEKLAGEF